MPRYARHASFMFLLTLFIPNIFGLDAQPYAVFPWGIFTGQTVHFFLEFDSLLSLYLPSLVLAFMVAAYGYWNDKAKPLLISGVLGAVWMLSIYHPLFKSGLSNSLPLNAFSLLIATLLSLAGYYRLSHPPKPPERVKLRTGTPEMPSTLELSVVSYSKWNMLGVFIGVTLVCLGVAMLHVGLWQLEILWRNRMEGHQTFETPFYWKVYEISTNQGFYSARDLIYTFMYVGIFTPVIVGLLLIIYSFQQWRSVNIPRDEYR